MSTPCYTEEGGIYYNPGTALCHIFTSPSLLTRPHAPTDNEPRDDLGYRLRLPNRFMQRTEPRLINAAQEKNSVTRSDANLRAAAQVRQASGIRVDRASGRALEEHYLQNPEQRPVRRSRRKPPPAPPETRPAPVSRAQAELQEFLALGDEAEAHHPAAAKSAHGPPSTHTGESPITPRYGHSHGNTAHGCNAAVFRRIQRQDHKVGILFANGEAVEALYGGAGGDGEYFPGRVLRQSAAGAYDIRYDDGDEEAAVPARLIRRPGSAFSSLEAAAQMSRDAVENAAKQRHRKEKAKKLLNANAEGRLFGGCRRPPPHAPSLPTQRGRKRMGRARTTKVVAMKPAPVTPTPAGPGGTGGRWSAALHQCCCS